MKRKMVAFATVLAAFVLLGCPGTTEPPPPPDAAGGKPAVTITTPEPGASQLSGWTYNVDPATAKVVIYVLTNQWYVQPLIDAPFTTIAKDGSWTSPTYPWQVIVVLLVNPTTTPLLLRQ